MSGFSAFLLAAGRGRRAGGPKAWLDWEGRSLLKRQVEFLTGRYGSGRVAVTVQEGWLDRCVRIDAGVRWVGEDPDRSSLHALQTLIRESGFSGWVSLHHVDMPVWDGELFDLLEASAAEASRRGKRAVVAVHRGRGGHPVFLFSGAFEELAALDPDSGRLDHWLRIEGAQRADVNYGAVLENLNEGGVLKR